MAGPVNNAGPVTPASLIQDALDGGDMESMLLALGIERAEGLDKTVKQQIQQMKANQAEITRLNGLKAMLASIKDDDGGGTSITKDPEQIKQFVQFMKDNPDMWANESVHGGMNFYDASGNNIHTTNLLSADPSTIKEIKTEKYGSGSAASLKTAIQNRIDSLTSNDQLQMVNLQSLVSKQNNAIEMVSTIAKKYADLKDSIVRKMG